MPHVSLPEGLPGILGPLTQYPETGNALTLLANALLVHETPSLSKGDRETIASYVSYLNGCLFCSESHGGAADAHLGQPGHCRAVWASPDDAPISPRLRALLAIAARVQQSGRALSPEHVAAARALGANDRDLHDTVLIAAAFCMYNRYVDGLATTAPPAGDPAYAQMGQVLAAQGYQRGPARG